MTRRIGALGMALGCLAVLSCSGGPQAGDLTVELVTPAANDGAVGFRITAAEGEEIASVAATCAGCEVLVRQEAANRIAGVLVGDLPAGPVMRLTVSDVGAAETYAAVVLEVADRENELAGSAGYELRIRG